MDHPAQPDKEETPAEASEDRNSPRNELFELILAYLPPIPNSEGWECRGTVAEKLADVLMEDNYRKLVAEKTEWQVRMPEDRNSEDGWQKNGEMGATYLESEHGAEVRTRIVTEWQVREH